MKGQEQPLLPEECYQQAMSLRKSWGSGHRWTGAVEGLGSAEPASPGGAVEKGPTGKKVGGPGDEE